MQILFNYIYLSENLMSFIEKNNLYFFVDYLTLYLARNFPDDLYFIETSTVKNVVIVNIYTDYPELPFCVFQFQLNNNIENPTMPNKLKMNITNGIDGKKLCILSFPNED